MASSAWSVPEVALFREAERSLEEGRPTVLATIIEVEGNAYRRPGAKMLISEDARGVGSITAGCLEDELVDIAETVREDGQPRVERYDLMEDEDDVWGLGVGCNGVIDVLLEPLEEEYRPVLHAVQERRSLAVVTVVESEHPELDPGTRAFVHSNGTGFEDRSVGLPDELCDEIASVAPEFARRGAAAIRSFDHAGGSVGVFLDGIPRRPQLLIVGSGHDVGPLVEMATMNDFLVTVVGYRGAVDLEERFPDANTVITTSPRNLTADVEIDEDTYAVVMTHNFVDDQLTLDTLLQTSVLYVGLMGPRERFEELRDALASSGRELSSSELDRLYTPVGLDLGGGSPHQIAHSIVGEVLTVHNDREPTHLKDRAGPIHDRVTVE